GGGHADDVDGLRDLVRAEGGDAAGGGPGGGGQGAGDALPHRPVDGLADEVLVAQRHEDRPAGGDDLVDAAQQLETVEGVLAEVVRRVEEDPLLRDADADGAFGQAGGLGDDVGHDVVETHPVGPRAGFDAAGVGTDVADTVLSGDLDQFRVIAGPRVVDQTGPGADGLVGDGGPPGVHGDEHVRVALRDGGDDREDAVEFLGGVDT